MLLFGVESDLRMFTATKAGVSVGSIIHIIAEFFNPFISLSTESINQRSLGIFLHFIHRFLFLLLNNADILAGGGWFKS